MSNQFLLTDAQVTPLDPFSESPERELELG